MKRVLLVKKSTEIIEDPVKQAYDLGYKKGREEGMEHVRIQMQQRVFELEMELNCFRQTSALKVNSPGTSYTSGGTIYYIRTTTAV